MVDYTNTTVSGYNTSPPVDDGTESEANRTKWSTVKSKLADPLKTAIESIDTNLQTSFGSIPALTGTHSIWVSVYEMYGASLSDGGTIIEYRDLTNSSTDPSVDCFIVLPNKWNAGAITVVPYLIKPSTGSGDVKIDVSAASIGDDDVLSVSAGSSETETTSVPGTQFDTFKVGPMTITPSNTPAPGDMLRVHIERDYGDSADTYSNEIGIIGMKLTYTATSVTDD